jgi:hypothetical protein
MVLCLNELGFLEASEKLFVREFLTKCCGVISEKIPQSRNIIGEK